MFRRKKNEQRAPVAGAAESQAAADASLARAEQDVAHQRERLAAEIPLRRQLQEIRAKNHLAEQLYAVLSERRSEGKG